MWTDFETATVLWWRPLVADGEFGLASEQFMYFFGHEIQREQTKRKKNKSMRLGNRIRKNSIHKKKENTTQTKRNDKFKQLIFHVDE